MIKLMLNSKEEQKIAQLVYWCGV